MSWPSNFHTYVNCGFFFSKPCPRVREFFATWHELWLTGVSATGLLRDQPSFNRSIVLSHVEMKVLPSKFNAQLATSLNRSSQAIVWHFYASQPDENSFGHLAKVANGLCLSRLRHLTLRALAAPAPWPNVGWFARSLAARVESRGRARTEEWLWLHGRRKDAARFALAKAWNGLAKRSWRADGVGRK